MGVRQSAVEKMVVGSGFWKDKKVFITGHTGFKGAWLSLWLHWMGARIAGYALRPPSDPNLFELCDASNFIASGERDVRDFTQLCRAVDETRPEIVFHLAAQSLVRRSYDAPLETYATNVMGTANLLEAVRRCSGVKAVIVVTSDKCYENREWLWGYREDEPMGGFDPYSSSKGCAELVTAAYRQSFLSRAESGGMPVAVASARAGNVIGGGDWARDRLIPDVLNAFASGRPALIRSPAAVRPWQHVLESLSGYLMLAERLWKQGDAHAGAWNFGPSDDSVRPVSWIVERLAAMWGNNASWQVDGAPQPHEAGYLKLDCSKARTRLGWAPRLDLDTALEWIVEWHRTYLGGKNVRDMTVSQIARYQSLVS
jgi:CDP-glucose 4,6-dehydratase